MTTPFNWTDVSDEAIDLFKGLLRLDTTNPPGDERLAVDYLAELLREDGIEPWIAESVDERGNARPNLVARLPATVDEREKAGGPLLLAGHTDVVPADADRWTHPPFDAVEDEGCIWGRGAVDMKNMVAMSAMVMKLLARAGDAIPRRRDLIFAAVADEERGCTHGSQFLVEEHPERVRAEYMLGEVGGFWLDIQGVTFIPVMVAEKGQARLKITAAGQPGHGSMPRRDTAVRKLARAVEILSSKRLPYRKTPVMERFIRGVADEHGLPTSAALKGLLNKRTAHLVIDHLLPDADKARNFDALLHNTASPTILRAGEKLNVIPGEASVECDGRLVPGSSGEDLKREVEELLEAAGLEGLEVDLMGSSPAVETDLGDRTVLEAIDRVCGTRAPDAVPIPYMIPGFTDARYFSRLGTKCFGFSPLKLQPDSDLVFSELFHGIDERVPADGFRWGVRVLFEVVEELL